MKEKRLKCSMICGGVFAGLFLFVVIGLESVVRDFVQSQLVMAPDTYDMWGANPGATETLTLRNFTFYNFTNPRAYLYRNQTPLFTEISGYLYQERSNFTNYVYSQDMSELHYDYWLYFTELPGTRDLSQHITILNVVPVSFWSQLDGVPPETFALQGFGGLFVEMNATIKTQAIGQGLASQYLSTNSSLSPLCNRLELSFDSCQRLWNDKKYGLSNPNNYGVWVDFAYYNQQGAEHLLFEYFSLSRLQMGVLRETMRGWCESVNGILNNWYCAGRECTNYELTVLQLSAGGLTNNPPSGDPVESICSTGNATCIGSPEISTYLHNQFRLVSNDTKYQTLTFSVSSVSKLFTPHTGTFLNIGRLAEVFRAGFLYDQSPAIGLLQLQKLLHADTSEHAFVLWNYVKYFTNQFVLKTSLGGTRKMAALGGIFAQSMYTSYTAFGSWFLRDTLSLLSAEIIGNCTSFFQRILPNVSTSKREQICSNVSLNNYSSYWAIVSPCANAVELEPFRKDMNLSLIEAQEYCDERQQSVRTVLQQAHRTISAQYGCKTQVCSTDELALKQFINSTITLNPIQNTLKSYPSVLTAKRWNTQLSQFEYRNYLLEYYGRVDVDPCGYADEERLAEQLSFDRFFSAPMMAYLHLVEDEDEFAGLFYWRNRTLLLNYMRFVAIEVGLGGYTVRKTVRELVFGYRDEFLQGISESDPMVGGDPSINPVVALNEPNCSLAEASLYPQVMYTGYSGAALTRQYKSMYAIPFITFNKTSFDGTRVVSSFVNPFKLPAFINGTDAFQNPPSLPSSHPLYIYVTNLYRVGILEYQRQEQRYGFQLRRYKLSDRFMASAAENPQNDNFYQYESNFLNLSFTGVPIFISRNHMLGVREKWQKLIRIQDEHGNEQEPNTWDETYLIIEPTTGASFTAVVFLQTNILTPSDLLYQNEPRMLPVFSLYRSANVTEAAATKYFGDLKLAIAAPRKLLLFTVIGMLSCLLAALIMLHQRKNKTHQPMSSLIETETDPKDDKLQEEIV